MSEPTARIVACCHHDSPYCSRCDLLVGLDGLHVTFVGFDRDAEGVGVLTVHVESPPGPMGCTTCGVIAHSHGRRDVTLVDAPCFDRPVQVVWRKRAWRCGEPACATKAFTEQNAEVAAPRALLTTRACWWAINQIRREHASIRGLARQLGTTWNTVWTSTEPLLQEMADDESRFAGVKRLGVDEHVWHHMSEFPIEDGGRGQKLLTGMVDLTPDANGKPTARLLDLVPGRSGKAYSDWLTERGEDFRDGVEVATLDPFHGYKNAIDDNLEDATAVLDAFHVVKLGTQAVDEVRRRVQQQMHGHRGRRDAPLYGIRTIVRCGAEKLTDRQRARLARAIDADERHDEVLVAWWCAQKLRSAYKTKNTVEGRRSAEDLISLIADVSDPGDQAARQDVEAVARSVPGLLRHRPRQQRRRRGHQRAHRTPPPRGPRLAQPRALPPTHAADWRRTHPRPPQVGRAVKAQRLALGLRDGGCAAKGCETTASGCHAHHDDPWSRGGLTDLANGRLLCPRHHRLAHDSRYAMTVHADNKVTFVMRT